MQFNQRLAEEQKVVGELEQELEVERRGKAEARKLEEELNAVVEEMEAVKQELQLLYARTEEESSEKSELSLQIEGKELTIVELQRKVAKNDEIVEMKGRELADKVM